MTKFNNNQSDNLFSQVFGVAKKLSSTGLNILQQSQIGEVSKLVEPLSNGKTVEGSARNKSPFEVEQYESPQQMLREHLPKVTRQVFGRHFRKVNGIATFISPDWNEKISSYLFDWLNDFSLKSTLTEKILEEAGAKDLFELTKDTSRSQRLSQALIEQNKLIASIQGAITGVSGMVGAAIDIPVSLVLVLRTIYQTGRSHGFDLTEATDQDVVEFIFKEVDISLIAEKQTLLLALKALRNMLETQDIQQFQQVLGSSNDIETLKSWLVDENGEFKWNWLNKVPQLAVVGKFTPVAGAVLSAVYSWKLQEDVGHKAQAIFGAARHYLNEHPNEHLSPLQAYYAAVTLIQKASPRLLNVGENGSVHATQHHKIENHDVISKVSVVVKSNTSEKSEEKVQENVHQGIEHLAEKHVVEHEHSEQKPALEPESEENDDVIEGQKYS
ncbi:EcsC family protein [Acinetobacter baumannii]|uniref:EcsC family protein n=1 Tax=Acinetobacter baumannii TaxID=470 RepID=UPI00070B4B45|nr:EcsC family protein [Acinetobacter baumannii]KQF12758.1 EcsC family protein [Acinetobacter baumannii]KQF14413.1 EcsC family protein [Acinetobacter baumannii]